MANTNEQDQSANPVDNELSNAHPNPRKKYCSCLNLFTLILSLLALVIAGYSWYCMQKSNRELKSANLQLTTNLQHLLRQNQKFDAIVKEKTDAFQKTNQAIEEKINYINKQIQTVAAKKSNDSQDWLLLKVRYYLELAQINAHWSLNANDASSTILLKQADKLLAQINNPEFFNVRQIIAKEIQQLKSLEKIDLPGLLSQFEAIESQLSQLTVQVPSFTEPSNEQSKNSMSESSWEHSLNSSFKILKTLVVIRRNNEEIKPLLSPYYMTVLKESVRLNIQEAQWALITHNATAYQFALNQALVNIKKGFNINLHQVSTVINQLTELQKVNLLEKSPAIGEALPLINQFIKNRLSSNAESTEEELL